MTGVHTNHTANAMEHRLLGAAGCCSSSLPRNRPRRLHGCGLGPPQMRHGAGADRSASGYLGLPQGERTRGVPKHCALTWCRTPSDSLSSAGGCLRYGHELRGCCSGRPEI